MKIAIVNDLISRGGAAIACNRLASALISAGAEIRRFAFERGARPVAPNGPSFASEPFGRRAAALADAVDAFGLTGVADRMRHHDADARLASDLQRWRPDVINLHNLHGFSPRLGVLSRLLEIAPVVWTLHDMWSFTGRCSYCFDCNRFETGCTSACPTAREYPKLAGSLIRSQWNRRRKIFARSVDRLVAATPSRWMAGVANRGLWKGHRIAVIPNSLDQTVYSPVPRPTARAALGLPPRDRPSLLVVADYLNERRKGGDTLLPALAACEREIELIALGNNLPRDIPPNVSLRPLGYIAHERTKALVYSSADLFFHPAPTDNFPNTIAESLSCGTPVVAAAVGGIPEMMPTPECGVVAPAPDVAAFAKAIVEALAKAPVTESARRIIQDTVRPLYAPARQAAEYLELCTKALDAPAPLLA